MIKEPASGARGLVGYPVSRRAVLAGTVAAGALAWARKPAGPGAAQANEDLGWSGGPANVRVSRDAFTMHAEPSLAANPTDPRNLLAACMVWQSGRRGLATYVSFDEGSTWHSNGLLPGVTPAYDGDVTVAFDHHGTGYVSGWAGSRAAEQRGRAYLWRTADGGRSFEPLRFPDPGSDLHGGRAPMMTAGQGGLAAIAYYAELPDFTQRIKVVTTADHGQTLTPPVFVTHVSPPPMIGGVNTTTGGPAITADGEALHLAVATVDTKAQASELLLFTSRDQGRTWTRLRTVARSTTTAYFQPQLATGPGGRIALSAFALPVATGQVSVVLFISHPHSTRFGPPVTVTTRPFNPHAGTQQGWIGDYQGLTATPRAFHPLWNDTRTGRLQIFTSSIKPG